MGDLGGRLMRETGTLGPPPDRGGRAFSGLLQGGDPGLVEARPKGARRRPERRAWEKGLVCGPFLIHLATSFFFICSGPKKSVLSQSCSYPYYYILQVSQFIIIYFVNSK